MNLINIIFPLDYIILTITLLIIIFSAFKGFIQSLLGLMTWVGSIIITLYSYDSFANYINNQLYKINFFQNYDFLTNVLSIIIAIPIIFLISLFILKRIRKILSSDLDKQIFGIIIDKFFGIIYGIAFSYIIFSSLIFALEKFNLNDLNQWLLINSEILNNIFIVNQEYIYNLIPNNNENNF
ncbi:MAG: hypothetical protein CFH16_01069 [Alphaproteobacteria bacterium MarineAlpha5_Bin6]|nr:MAG: hypothetical protein CFH17_00233 [Alphaproteobacteria bacterium MarineAlpha5_Bin7]PPR53336.1 MAG: hypothetical protein CFH16_01069 [Alphaproteobacteria bacterium MarineAlpha5_Bin6]|tara:strand:- start:576 stop:1121 length:546 start_codon:yes stop_codon:yes gene_type:complete